MSVYLVNGQLVSVPDRGTNRLRIEYMGTNPLYIGSAEATALDSDSVWVIKKLTFTGDNVTSIQVRTDTSWNNRATPTTPWE